MNVRGLECESTIQTRRPMHGLLRTGLYSGKQITQGGFFRFKRQTSERLVAFDRLNQIFPRIRSSAHGLDLDIRAGAKSFDNQSFQIIIREGVYWNDLFFAGKDFGIRDCLFPSRVVADRRFRVQSFDPVHWHNQISICSAAEPG